jgi:hypothetical protein
MAGRQPILPAATLALDEPRDPTGHLAARSVLTGLGDGPYAGISGIFGLVRHGACARWCRSSGPAEGRPGEIRCAAIGSRPHLVCGLVRSYGQFGR